MQFFETAMGHKFFEVQLPKLIKTLGRIADAMEKEHKSVAGKEDVISEHPMTVRQLLYKVPAVQEITIISKEAILFKGYCRALGDDLQKYWEVQLRFVKNVVTHGDEEDVLYIYLEEE